MKQLDIKFVKERDSQKAAQQAVIITQLETCLAERISEVFKEVNVRVRFSSAAGVEVTGFKDKEERERFMRFLEELWTDDGLSDMA
ncbi:DinI family protein [Actinobacillus succinogenes]|uniref:DinI family protein n=1 Tax=Actinobacillus succinogenes (strain ATCC 55618 / DSM 22257 / CCUG 43843 / 130Z) TaxID=339671 RepID=A6VLI2_ACTSZ|nr:DinI-like family protein [Actinobacillus succinogenes]ABR73829.1 DinI family protein [Actinobacillus succinogenes 130Z]PHI39719.1 DinI family protein [Actinobacillus succinogenes]